MAWFFRSPWLRSLFPKPVKTIRKKRPRPGRLRLEELEDRTLMASPQPVVTFTNPANPAVPGNEGALPVGALTNRSIGTAPQIAVNPLNPSNQVAVATNDTGTVLRGWYSTNSGGTWTDFINPQTPPGNNPQYTINLPNLPDPTLNGVIPGPTNPVRPNPVVRYAQVAGPSVTFDRNNQVYIGYIQRAADLNSGAVVVQKYDFPIGGAPSLLDLDPTNTEIGGTSLAAGTTTNTGKIVYRWFGGADVAFNTTVAIDNNEPTYTDPATGLTQTDTNAGGNQTLYVAWNTNNRNTSPATTNFNPNVIMIAASEPVGAVQLGQQFTNPQVVVNGGGAGAHSQIITGTVPNYSAPQIMFRQGTPGSPGGDVIILYNDFSINRVMYEVFKPDGGNAANPGGAGYQFTGSIVENVAGGNNIRDAGVQVQAVAINAAPANPTSTRYALGNTLTLAGGTAVDIPSPATSNRATLNVSAVGLSAAALTGSGAGYTAGDVLTVSGGAFTTQAQITVNTITGPGPTGPIGTASISTIGSYTSLAGVTGAVTGGSGAGATFNLTFNVLTGVTIATAGSYLVFPTNPVSLIGGDGPAQFDLTPGGASPGTPDLQTTNTFVVSSNITDPNFVIRDLSVQMTVLHPKLQDLDVALFHADPDGAGPLTAVNIQMIRNRKDGFDQDIPPAPATPRGLTGANLGLDGVTPDVNNGFWIGTVFSDNAVRAIQDASFTAPYLATFRPETGSMNAALTAASFGSLYNASPWELRITDHRNDRIAGPPPVQPTQRIEAWRLTLSDMGTTTRTGLGTDRVIPTPTTVNPGIPVVGSFNNNYPLRVGSAPAGTSMGIGPGIVGAVDNSLGSFSPFQGRSYVAYVGTDGSAADNTDIFLLRSDNLTAANAAAGTVTWTGPTRLNQDVASDNFSEGNRTQFMPALAVDNTTGSLVATWYDGRFDAAHVRLANFVSYSITGGVSFSTETWMNPTKTARDGIDTTKTISIEPIPGNQSGTGALGFGDRSGLAAYDGKIFAVFASNANNNQSRIQTANVRIPGGPRVQYDRDDNANNGIQGDYGPIVNNFTFGAVTYNNTFATDGTRQFTDFIVVFDRRVDESTFGANDVTVRYHDTTTLANILGPIIPLDPVTPIVALNSNAFGATQFRVRLDSNATRDRVGTYSYSVGPNIQDRVRTITTSTQSLAPGLNVFVPRSMRNIVVGSTVVIDTGGSQENVVVTATTATTFTATTVNAHDGSVTPFPIRPLGNLMDQNADGTSAQNNVDTFAAPNPTSGTPFQLPYTTDTLPLIVPGPHVIDVNPENSYHAGSAASPLGIPIPPSGTGGSGVPAQDIATSDIFLNGVTGNVTGVKVNVSLNHSAVGDLRITLLHTNATGTVSVLLFDQRGGTGDNLTNLTFSDEVSGQTLAAGAAPFYGYFRPEAALNAALAGRNPNGTWRLQIEDRTLGNTGTLLHWKVIVDTADTTFADSRVINKTVSSVDVTFDRDMNAATFTPANILRVIGPAGPITGTFTVTPITSRVFRVGLPYTQFLSGTYTVVVGPDGTNNYITDNQLSTVAVVAGGTGYTVGDILDVQGGVFSTRAQLEVTSISGGGPTGPITGVRIARAGSYLFNPPNPAGVTGGTGANNATFQLTFGNKVDTNRNAGLNILRGIAATNDTITPISHTTGPIGPNNLPGNTTSEFLLSFPESFVIQGAIVQLNILHNNTPDLEASLIAPDNTTIRLFTQVGGAATPPRANFVNTIFDDNATTPIQQGSPPFDTGPFNPQTPLSVLVGKASNANGGVYRLQINNRGSTTGTLTYWSLILNQAFPGSGLGERVADQFTAPFRIFTQDPTNVESSNTWTAVGAASENNSGNTARIGGLAFDPSDPSRNTAYSAGASGGVWKTTDFLNPNAQPTWYPLTDLGPGQSLKMGGLAVFGRNNDPGQSIVFAATGDGDGGPGGVGFLRSIDGGRNWVVLDSTVNAVTSTNQLPGEALGTILSINDPRRDRVFFGTRAFKVIVDPVLTPSGETIVYAALSGGNGGIWRSLDTGKTWFRIRAGQADDVAFGEGSAGASGNLEVLYAAFRGDGVYFTPNAPTANSLNLMAGGQQVNTRRDIDTAVTTPVPVVAPARTPNGAKGRIVITSPAFTGKEPQDNFYQGWLYAAVATTAGNLEGLYMTKDFGRNWTVVRIPYTGGLTGNPTNNESLADFDPLTIGPGLPPQGNYDIVLTIDPNDPHVVYLGGQGNNLIRVDTTTMSDVYSMVAYDNSDNDGGATQFGSAGPVGIKAGPGPSVLTGGTLGTGQPWGLLDTNSGAYPGTGALIGPFFDMMANPNSPFFSTSSPQLSNITQFNNQGSDTRWRFFNGFLGGADLHRIVAFKDPLTGLTRLVVGNDHGIHTGVDNGGGLLLTRIGNANLPTFTRNGNMQIVEFYYGAAQPSTLAADLAGAMFYGMAQDDGFPISTADVLRTGELNWNGQLGDGTGVATDQTGSGTSYSYRWPCCINTSPFVETDFFLVDPPLNGVDPVSRTNGLIQAGDNPATGTGQWPSLGGSNFAVNPIDGTAILMSSQAGRLFRTAGPTTGTGRTWFEIGTPGTIGAAGALGDVNNAYKPAVAFGAPLSPTAFNDFMYAGGGANVFVTFNGGGPGQWRNISTGIVGSVQHIVANPQRGSREAYAITDQGVFWMADSQAAGNPAWVRLSDAAGQGPLLGAGGPRRPTFNNGSEQFSVITGGLTSIAADWRFAIRDRNGIISGATNAGPIVITTTTPHGLATGNQVVIEGVLGNTAANGTFTVTQINATQFSLNGSTGNGTYTAGSGVWGTVETHPVLYVAGEGGVYRSWDKGLTWTNFPEGINEQQTITVGAGVSTMTFSYLDVAGIAMGYNPGTTAIQVQNNLRTIPALAGKSGTVTGASNAGPIVVTTANVHGLTTGDAVTITGALGNTAANGTWTVTVLSPTTYSLNGSTGNGAYTANSGTWASANVSVSGPNGGPFVVTFRNQLAGTGNLELLKVQATGGTVNIVETTRGIQSGGFMPNVQINDLDLAFGNIDPASGAPNQSFGFDMLVATTYGRGTFVIRLPQTLPSNLLAAAVPTVPGPRVERLDTPDQGAANMSRLDVTFSGPGIAEVQTVTITQNSGTFRLTFRGAQTGDLNFNATATDVQTALNGLTTIGGVGGSVSVTLLNKVYTVTFQGSLSGVDVPAMTITPTNPAQPGQQVNKPGSGFTDGLAGGVDPTSFTVADIVSLRYDGLLGLTPGVTDIDAPNLQRSVRDITTPLTGNQNPHNRYQITFPAQTAQGIYTLRLGPNISDFSGNLMDQNENFGTTVQGRNGEATDAPIGDIFVGSFYYQPFANTAPVLNTGGAVTPQSINEDPGSEVQTVTVNVVTPGTFVLQLNGFTTTSLAFNATAAQVQAALNALPTIGGVGGSVTVTQAGNVYTVTFGGTLAQADMNDMTAVGTGIPNPAIATVSNGANNGYTVAQYLATAGATITDPNDGVPNPVPTGIAVTQVDNSNGQWQYSVNGGQTWRPFGPISADTARLLSNNPNNRIRFVPVPNFFTSPAGTTVTFNFLAWDHTTGFNGGIANASTTGGTTAFGTVSGTARLTVNPVNDAPSFTAGPNQTVPEDAGFQLVSNWATNLNKGALNESAETLTFTVTVNGYAISNVTGLGTNPIVVTSIGHGLSDGHVITISGVTGNPAANGSFVVTRVDSDNFSLNGTTGAGTAGASGFWTRNITNTTGAGTTPIRVTAAGHGLITGDRVTISGVTGNTNANGTFTVTRIDADNFDLQGSTGAGTAGAGGTWFKVVFAVGGAPAVSGTNGNLTFTPAFNTVGSAHMSVVINDDGGTNPATPPLSSPPQFFTINVLANNDAPVGANNTVTGIEDTPYVFQVADFPFTDPLDSPPNVLFAVRITTLALPLGSSLKNNGVDVTAGQTILLADITAGRLIFTPGFDANGVNYASFTFQVQDDGGTNNGGVDLDPTPRTMQINVTGVNDAPRMSNGFTVNLAGTNEDTTSTPVQISTILAAVGLNYLDPDTPGPNTGVAITAFTGLGVWQYSTDNTVYTNFPAVADATSLLLTGSTFIRYAPNPPGANAETATFTFRGWDQSTNAPGSVNGTPLLVDTTTNGGGTAFSSQTATASLATTNVNDAPVINNATATPLTTIDEDAITNTGNLVSSIIVGANIADVDTGAIRGIAVTAFVDNGRGTWQYSIDGGTNWFAIGAVTDNSARVLGVGANDRIRFLPNTINGTTATITFRAWDQSNLIASGTAGVNVSTNGGTTPYSSATATASITVTEINDAPTITNGFTFNMAGVNEDTTSAPVLVSAILTAATYADNDSATNGIAITALTGAGTWQYSDAGTTWANFTAVSGAAALLLPSTSSVRYIPDPRNAETATFTFRGWDRFTGTPSTEAAPQTADTTTNGGNTAFSSQTATVSITTTDLNDAPVINNATATPFTTIDESQTNNTGNLVSSIIVGANITDVDTGFVRGIAITGLSNGNGSWEYSINGGTNWFAIGAVSDNSARVLGVGANDRIRFVPNNLNGTTASVTFRAWDTTDANASGTAAVNVSTNGGTTAYSTTTATASITVTDINDAPTITNAFTFNMTGVNEDTASAGVQVSTILTAAGLADTDGPGSGMAITAAAANGNWQYSDAGVTWVNFPTVSTAASLLLAGTSFVRYQPDLRNAETATFTFRGWDRFTGTASTEASAQTANTTTTGDPTAFSTETATVSIAVSALNDAPVLSGANNFTTITENDVNNNGDLVSALVSTRITDVDTGAVQGIAITGLVNGNGSWEYSINGGTNWFAIGAVSDNSARVLGVGANDRIRFVPNGLNGTTGSVTFRAWDTTDANASGTAAVNVSTNGGTTAYSSATATANITVNSVNDAPVLAGANNFTTITEDQTTNNGDLVSTLVAGQITDADTGAVQGIAVTGLVNGNGSWEYSINGGTNWLAMGAVSGASARVLGVSANDRIRFVPNGLNGTAASITFRAWDQSNALASGTAGVDTSTNGTTTPYSLATATANITVNSVNDAPVLAGANNFTGISEDQTTNTGDLVSALVATQITDVDAGAVQGIAITGLVNGNGSWEYSINGGTNWFAIGAVSDNSARVLGTGANDRIRFVPNALNGTTGSVTFRAWDITDTSASGDAGVNVSTNGGTTPYSSASATANITVSSVNDAPVLAGANNFTTITEDQTTNNGDLVSTLVAGQITDVDTGAVQGIAVTSVVNGNGSWEYSINGGTNWLAMGAVSGASARVLGVGANDRIRFVPNGLNGTAASITFRAWDQSNALASGTAGVDTSTNGTTTPYSLATATASITVNSVNDAPVLAGANNFAGISEDQTTNTGDLVSALVTGQITDADTGAVQGIAITGLVNGNGSWEYSINGGTNWFAIGAVSDASARVLGTGANDRIRFVPNALNGTTGSVTFRAWDTTDSNASGTAGVNVSTNGGTTAYSSASATANITVSSVNDAPVLAGANNFTTITEDQTTNNGDLVSALVAGQITDVDTGAVQGIAITGLVNGNGSWEYSINGGTNWLAIGAVANNSARVLGTGANDRIRFVPNGIFGTAGSVTFRAWDTTDANPSGTAAVDVSTNGGTTAYSNTTATASITVTEVNDLPVVDLDTTTGSNDVTVNFLEQTPLPISPSVSITDLDHTNLVSLTATLTARPDGNLVESLSLNTAANTARAGAGLTFSYDSSLGIASITGPAASLATYQTILQGILYNNNSDNPNITNRTVNVAVSDGVNTSVVRTSTITITRVNDAPTLAGANNFTSITEDQTNTNGDLVSALVSGQITDPDNTQRGIAITGLNPGNGGWQFSTNGGTIWNTINAASDGDATVLGTGPNDRIRFIPNARSATAASITFRAWDQSNALASGTEDVVIAAFGGATAYSATTATASITVTEVNDAPTLVNGSVVSATGTNENTTSPGTAVSTLLTGAGHDPVDTGAQAGIAITGKASSNVNGWEYSTDGTNWTPFGTVSGTSALLLTSTSQVRYVPDNANGETATFTFRAWDQTSGTASTFGSPSTTNPGAGGGTTAFSTQSATVNLVVTSVNDPPIAVPGGPYSVSEGGSFNLNGSGSSDPDIGGSITTYQWDFGNNGSFEISTASPITAVTWANLQSFGINDGAATVPIVLRVTDNNTAQTTSSVVNLTVNNTAPTINLTGNGTVNEGELYTLTLGTATDPGADTITNWRINWGDGTQTTGAGSPNGIVRTHTYANEGNLTITVDLQDEDGFHSASGSKALTVNNVGSFLSGTLSDSLVVDINNNGLAEPGDIIEYTATVTNNGPDNATGVTYSANLDPNQTLVVPAPAAPVNAPLFTDNFNRTASTSLGANWTEQVNNTEIDNNRIEGVDGSLVNLATVNGVWENDVRLEADFDLSPAGTDFNYIGLIARYQGAGDQNFYMGRVYTIQNILVADIYRNVGGNFVQLNTTSALPGGPIGTIRFEVIGPALRLFVNNNLVLTALDSNIREGRVGVRMGNRVGIDNFTATRLASGTFTDNFNRTDSANIGTNYAETGAQATVGDFSISGNQLRGVGGFINVAALSSQAYTDVSVQADINLPTNTGFQHAGLTARYQGNGSDNMYAGLVFTLGPDENYAMIWKSVNGGAAALDVQRVASPTGTLRFEVLGNTLKLYLNEALVGSAVDGSLTGPGLVGVRSSNQSYDNLSVTPLFSNLGFSEAFNRGDSTLLGRHFKENLGDYSVQANRAVVTGSNFVNIAVFQDAWYADVSVQADVNITGSGFTHQGVIARYQGVADQDMYAGVLWGTPGNYNLSIFRNLNGNWAILTSTPTAVTAGTLRFEAVGSTLRLFFNNTLVGSTTDAVFKGPGLTGIRSGGPGQAMDNFSVQPLAAAAFFDLFNRTDNTNLGVDYSEVLGDMGIVSNRVQANGASNLTTVLNTQEADVSVSATVNLNGVGSQADLVGRYAGPGDTNMYIGRLANVGGTVFAQILRNVSGTVTQLVSNAVASSTGVLRFDVQGNSLSLFLDSTPVAQATDLMLHRPGLVGMRGTSGVTFDNLNVTPLVIATQATGNVSRNLGTLTPGQSMQTTYRAIVNNPLPANVTQVGHNGTATGTDSGTGIPYSPVNTNGVFRNVTAAPDNRVSVTGPAETMISEIITYTISYANLGTQDATGVVLRMSFSANAVPVNMVVQGGTIFPTGAAAAWNPGSGSTFDLILGNLAARTEGFVTLIVRINQPLSTPVNMTATASVFDDGLQGADLNNADNMRTTITTVRSPNDP